MQSVTSPLVQLIKPFTAAAVVALPDPAIHFVQVAGVAYAHSAQSAAVHALHLFGAA